MGYGRGSSLRSVSMRPVVMDRLLRGQVPPGGGCDIRTLAAEAGVSRAALYRSYAHLKAEFERRLEQMRSEGHLPDPKAAQILRLKDDNAALRRALADRAEQITELTAFKTTAISRLAAQHDEISRLRTALTSGNNVRSLHAGREVGAHSLDSASTCDTR